MSPWQFTMFRIVFGTYLTIHFLQLAPYAGELFGAGGLISDPSLNPAYGLFPNPLNHPFPGPLLTGFLIMLAVLSALFAAGVQRHAAALLLWFGWTALFHRNNLIANPSLAYVGLLLVLTILIPRGEPWSFPGSKKLWSLPKWVFCCAWILLAAGYSFSGITKLASPSWIDGTAIHHLLNNPLARPGIIRDGMLLLPEPVLTLATWLILAAELLFLPLAIWSRSRPWIWLSMVLMHVGILFVVDFADLSSGMLMVHLFTFDPGWFPPKRLESPAILAFDGECMMCSRAMRFLASEDRTGNLRFTALQGELGGTIRQKLGENESGVDSMVLDSDGRTLNRSEAVLEVLEILGGHWRAMAITGRWIPTVIRNKAYDLIAKNRHRWPTRRSACGLPSEELVKRLL